MRGEIVKREYAVVLVTRMCMGRSRNTVPMRIRAPKTN
jgi:hypothetical protein